MRQLCRQQYPEDCEKVDDPTQNSLVYWKDHGRKKSEEMNITEQLAHLRRTVAEIDRKYAPLPASTPPPPAQTGGFLEDLISGETVETSHGKHFETEQFYPVGRRHGSFDISDLSLLHPGLLDALSNGAIPHAPPETWAFLDTETTGLAGGSGTYAFLIGVGSIHPDGFRVRQFFLRDYSDERSALHALSEYLRRFAVLITYNGKSYDQPLLETRYTMCRARHPFGSMEHLDLLYGARRLYKLRLENCRLVNLESEILSVEREGDIPGEMIPYTYFEFLRTKRARRLVPIFHHNVLDIVSLACMTAVIPEAFRDPANVRARHGTDLLGVARWLEVSGRLGEARQLLARAVDLGLPDSQLFRALFEAAQIDKKLNRESAAMAMFLELTESPNPYQAKAHEELAKFHEHKDRNYELALEHTRAARRAEDSIALRNRQDRLERKCVTSRQPKLAMKARA